MWSDKHSQKLTKSRPGVYQDTPMCRGIKQRDLRFRVLWIYGFLVAISINPRLCDP